MSIASTIYNGTNSHAGNSDRTVLRRIYQRMLPGKRRSREHRTARHEIYRECLDRHHQWQRIVAKIR